MLSARVPDGDGDDQLDAYQDFLRRLNEPTDADDDDAGSGAAGDDAAAGDDDDDTAEYGHVVSDEVSAADLNLKAHPLSALPHSLLAVAATFAVNSVVAVAGASAAALVGASVGGVAIGVGGGLVVAVLLLHPSLLLGFYLLKHARFGNSDRAILKLEREAHPRFFAVVDDVMARVGVSDIDVSFAAGANAHHAVVHGRPAVIIGYGIFAPYSLTALRSTLGHELGHAVGNDASDLDGIAFDIIAQLAKGRRLAGPWWRLLVRRSKADAMRRSRLREHAADFWGGLAAGAGTTEACLVEDRRSGLL